MQWRSNITIRQMGVRGVLHLDKMSTYSNKSVLPTFRIEPISQIFTGKG